MMIGQLPPSRSLPSNRRYAARRQLEETVGRRRVAPRRRRLILIVVIAVLLSSAAAGIAFLRSAPVTDKRTARCYTQASLGSGETFSGTTIGAPGIPGSTAQVMSAITVCSDLWRQGFLVPGANGIQRPKPDTSNRVPPLIACTLRDGLAGIFPGDVNTCATLGLPLAGK
jgi:hypothetical protein